MNYKLFPALLFVFGFTMASAQQFGAFPPSTNWQQINTDTAKIIFPGKVAPQAERIAAIIRQMARQDVNSLGGAVRKINILLHPNTTLANGYVALAPFRSEYYLLPASNLFEFGATPWIEELAVHEYRHVQQYSNLNKGLSKAAGFVFGQNGQALFNALAIPDWFFEGDAVYSETALTTQGRGRAPYFFNGYRALWHDQRDYSWMKLRNGSLKDFVPDYYKLGYLLTNYGYLKYGAGFWGSVTDDASRFRSLFYPFQHAVQRVSGKDFKSFRTEALDFYKHSISTRRDEKQKRQTVTNFLFPQVIGPDSLLYIKTAYNKIPAFYLKDARGEHRIKQRNITTEDWLSYRNGIVAYTGYATNPRWGLTDYSNVYLLNLATGKEKKITSKERYFTPDISPDGNRIVTVAFTDSAETELRLLNTEGALLQTIRPSRQGDLFVHPRFGGNNTLVVAVRHADATMSLQQVFLNAATVSFKTLVPPVAATIGYPYIDGDTVYFVSSAPGNDEIFSIDLTNSMPVKTLKQLTSGVTGNYYPSVYNQTLTWSGFTSNGFKLMQSTLDGLKPLVVSLNQFASRALPYPVASDSSTPNLLLTAGTAHEPVRNYKKTTGLLNFHSRQITYNDPEVTASIFSDNILNTFSNELFYRYNQNESSHAVGFASYYGGFFPVLDAGFTYTAGRAARELTKTYTANQVEVQGGYSIPLNFTGGKTVKLLSFGTNYVYNETRPTAAFKNRYAPRTFSYLSHRLTWSQQLPRAVQQLFPKFGYTVSLADRHLLNGLGGQFLGVARLYLPSVNNHSLVLAANWQETDTLLLPTGQVPYLSNRFANARGYNDYLFSRMWRVTGEYHLPLFYPDWGFANILYFLRVRGDVFYDYTRVYSRSKRATREQRSVGGEVYFDTKWWNMLPVSFGFRVSHLLDDDFSGLRPKGSNIFALVVPVNLIPR